MGASQGCWVSHRLPWGGGGNTAAPGFHGKLVRVGRPGVKAGPFFRTKPAGWGKGDPAGGGADGGSTRRRGGASRGAGAWGECGSGRQALQPVTQGVAITAFEAAFGPLPFPRFDEVLEAAGAFGGGLAAFGAALVALHAQLILALARDFQVRKLVVDPSSHIVLSSVRGMNPE